jgi:hypothetical protein
MSDTPETQCGTTHHCGCACHEKGWQDKLDAAVIEAVADIRAALADPIKVHAMMLRGTIAWTPEHLRHVIGDSPPNNEITKP